MATPIIVIKPSIAVNKVLSQIYKQQWEYYQVAITDPVQFHDMPVQ